MRGKEIEKAKTACENSGLLVADHFVEMHEMVSIRSGAERKPKMVEGGE